MGQLRPPEFDDRVVMEWFDLGWVELIAYLRAYARFDRWCAEHGRP